MCVFVGVYSLNLLSGFSVKVSKRTRMYVGQKTDGVNVHEINSFGHTCPNLFFSVRFFAGSSPGELKYAV